MATFLDPRDPPFPKSAKRRVRSEGHQGASGGMGMWIVGTAIACCTATCRDPPGAASFCKAVDSLGCARRRSPRQPLHHHSWHMVCTRLDPAIRRCETHQLPLHGPLFVQSAREKRQGLAVWPEGRREGIGSRSPREHTTCFPCQLGPLLFRRLEVGSVGLSVAPWEGVQLVLARPQGFPS
jgi:hypothetical protein